MKDHDGKIPLYLVMANSKCLKESAVLSGNSTIIQEFLDASIDKPNHWRDSQDLLRKLRDLPPWLRRHACVAKFVQETLMQEVTSPWNTCVVLLSGCVVVGLLLALRHSLDQSDDKDTWVLVNYFASYLLVTQLVYWVTAFMLGEFYHLCFSNPWRWIDLAAGTLAICTAYLVSVDIKALDATLGGFADFNPKLWDESD